MSGVPVYGSLRAQRRALALPAASTLAIVAGLGVLVGASALLRTGLLDIGYWTDEGIAVGIASQPLADIPPTLRLDGSPPLYYLLLHGWMELFGESEAATRGLSLVLALAAVPVAFWSGARLLGARGGWIAAALTACLPYLTVYGQETRMYALVALLSHVAITAYVLAGRGERRHLITLTAALTLLLYTHNWALFFCAALAGGALWRGRWRDALLVGAALAVLYAPWVPTLIEQAQHTGAPWSRTPGIGRLVIVPGAVFGAVGCVLMVGIWARAWRDRLMAGLLAVAAATAGLAWLASQAEPGWAVRYFAVIVGPLVIAAAAALDRPGAGAAWLLGAVLAACVLFPPPSVKSNARAVTDRLGLSSGDAVISSAPEQVPVLAAYLPAGVRFLTPSGGVVDPRVTDWRDVVARLRAAPTADIYDRAVAGLAPGEQLAVVTTLVHAPADPTAPLLAVSKVRGEQLLALAAADPRLEPVTRQRPLSDLDVRAQINADVFVRRR